MTEDPPVSAPAAAAPAPELAESWLRLAEALIFASPEPLSAASLARMLPDEADPDAVLAALGARYQGRGIELVAAAGGFQFRTAPDLAPLLRRVVQAPRRLPRAAMETLAIIAWRQPVTRAEIEELRGVALAQTTLDALLESGLIEPKGTRAVPGRPTLWGTGRAFLSQFGLASLADLPPERELVTGADGPGDPPPTPGPA